MLLHFDSSFVSPTVTHPLTFEFIAGCIIARLFYAGIKPQPVVLLSFGLLFLLLNFSIFCHLSSSPVSIGSSSWLRVFIFGIAGICIVFGAVVFEAKAKLFPRFL